MPTTQPALFESLMELPAVVWIVGLGGVAFAVRYVQLVQRAEALRRGGDSRPRLAALHAALTRFVEHHRRFPSELHELEGIDATDVAYRPPGAAPADEKLLVAHDARPTRGVIEFPHVRPAHHVLFWSGRVRLVTQSALERLLEADDAFRERSGGR